MYSFPLKLAVVAFLALVPVASSAATLTGDYFTHDPSRITKCNGKYFLYCTGRDLPMRYSTDLVHWEIGPPVLTEIPAWARQAVPGNRGDGVWAPDVIYLNKKYYLFYAFSTFGRKISVIGLLTSPTLDPMSKDYHWTDQGMVVSSGDTTDFNAIDPCPILDEHGDLWLSFGSWFGEGIVLVKLDKNTAKPISNFYPLAMKQKTGPEASYLYRHGGYYYLFENEGFCCRGVNSTYQIMMGRSKSITGPYLDKQGNDLANGAGTLFLGTEGNVIGPGQIGILSEKKADRFTFHYYDGANNGRPTLGFGTFTWGSDGWPSANIDPAAVGSAKPASP
jgi:arabinan endo-1,5-alpha-L-arabinosidase